MGDVGRDVNRAVAANDNGGRQECLWRPHERGQADRQAGRSATERAFPVLLSKPESSEFSFGGSGAAYQSKHLQTRLEYYLQSFAEYYQ